MHKSVNTHEIQSNQKWKFHLCVENCKKEWNSTRINSEKDSINSNNDTKCFEIVVCIRLLYVVRVLFVETWYSRSEIWVSKNFEQFFNFEPNGFLKNPQNHRFGSFFFFSLLTYTETHYDRWIIIIAFERWNETISNSLFDADARNWNFLFRWWVEANWPKN